MRTSVATCIFLLACAVRRTVDRTALSTLARLLESVSIRWVLIGALAANRYRTSPRLTQDVDLLLANRGSDGVLYAALQAAGWTIRHATAEGDLLRLRHPELGVADLLIAGTDYQQLALARGREEVIADGQSVWVATAEDVIVHKLIAGRHQDIADIESIIAARIALDESYIEHWAVYWDVDEVWATLRGPRT